MRPSAASISHFDELLVLQGPSSQFPPSSVSVYDRLVGDVLLLLLIVYVHGIRRTGISANVVAASCILLFGVQLLTLTPCVSY